MKLREDEDREHEPESDDPFELELSAVLTSVAPDVVVANTRNSVAVGPHEKLR